MTYKQYRNWCTERAMDCCWGFQEAKLCLEILGDIDSLPFWKRNKVWKKIEHKMLYAVIEPTNRKIQEIRGTCNEN